MSLADQRRVISVFEDVKSRVLDSMQFNALYQTLEQTILGYGCIVAEKDHRKSSRVYAHVGHFEHMICVSRNMEALPNKNLVGIFFHEFGHVVHFAKKPLGLTRELRNDFGLDCVRNKVSYPVEYKRIPQKKIARASEFRSVDPEIFADTVAERLFNVRIFYDERKVQSAELGD